MLTDYHTHPLAHHPTAVWTAELLSGFLAAARRKGLAAIGFTDHDRWLSRADFPLVADLRQGRAGSRGEDWPAISVGMEFDYAPERLGELRGLLATGCLDYAIGSVHSIGDWEIDDPARAGEYDAWDNDRLYETYFGLVGRAAATGSFRIIGHLDLIKIFGCRPHTCVAALAEPALSAIAAAAAAVEINTAGRYKPVGEFYPSRELLAACFEHNIPITLGSDAHCCHDVGRDLAEAAEYAKQVGYRSTLMLTDGEWVPVQL